MTRVLVLAGTGAIGKHLVHLLALDMVDVVVTSRQLRQPQRHIRYIQGDAHNSEFLDQLLNENWDVIVDFMSYKTSEFRSRLHRLLDSTRQYVFISSSRVYADSSAPLNENSPRLLDVTEDQEFLKTEEYSLAKARQEDLLFSSERKNWTIVRPYISYSEDRLQLGTLEKEGWLYRALQGRTIVFSRDIAEKTTTLTYGIDVALAMKSLMDNARALGQIYHVTSSGALPWQKVLDIYLLTLEVHLGRRPKVLLLGLRDFLRCRNAKYQCIYDRLFNRKFDNSKVSEFVDFRNFTEADRGLTECLKSFLQDPGFKPVDWRQEAAKDRICGEVARLSEIDGLKQKLKYLVYRYIRH